MYAEIVDDVINKKHYKLIDGEYFFMSKGNSESIPASVSDMLYYCEEFIFISLLFVREEWRNKGIGSACIKAIIDSSTVPVLLEAGFCPDETKSIEKLVKFYEKLGFVNVNNTVGRYDEGEEEPVAMLYTTDKELLRKVLEQDYDEQ